MEFIEKSERNSAIEALRILAMIFIVMSHASVHGAFELSDMPLSVNKLYLQISTLGNLGVDIFVMITGYLLCEKSSSIKRILKIVLQTGFYSVLTFVISILCGTQQVTLQTIVRTIFPVITAKYWFVTAYVCLVLISPMLNVAIENMKWTEFLKLIITVFVMWSIIPTFTSYEMYGDQIPQFMMFYLIGAYFRKYPDNFWKKRKMSFVVAGVSSILYAASVLTLNLLAVYVPAFAEHATYFCRRSSVLMIGIAVGLFATAVNTKPFVSSVVNYVGGGTLGIYLLHDSPDIRKFIWEDLFCNYQYADSLFLIPRILLSVCFIFGIGILIETIRKKFLEKKLISWVETKLDIVGMLIKKWGTKLKGKI